MPSSGARYPPMQHTNFPRNLSYLLRPDARPLSRELLEFVEITPSGTEAVLQATGFPMGDFEDAPQAAVALNPGAGCIVTRRLSDYGQSPVPPISPSEFSKKLNPD